MVRAEPSAGAAANPELRDGFLVARRQEQLNDGRAAQSQLRQRFELLDDGQRVALQTIGYYQRAVPTCCLMAQKDMQDIAQLGL